MTDPMNELRKCHFIRRTTGKSVPTNMVFVQCETIGTDLLSHPGTQVHTLRAYAACHIVMSGNLVKSERWDFGATPEQFHSFLGSCHAKRKVTYVFAHNLGLCLSATAFWLLIESGSYRLSCRRIKDDDGADRYVSSTCIADPPTIIDACESINGTNVRFIDTGNYWRCTIKELGESINLPVMPMPGEDADFEAWFCYVRRNVRIVIEATLGMLRFWRAEGLGSWRPTAASLSYCAYKTRFMQHKILVHGHTKVIELERESYYGGFNQCRFVGQIGNDVWERDYRKNSLLPFPCTIHHGSVYELDVNSMYPYVMQHNSYPRSLRRFVPCGRYDAILSELFKGDCVARVRIQSKQRTYPRRDAKATRYVAGSYVTTMAGPEVKYAIANGDVVDVYEVAFYHMAPLFSSFMSYWFARKDAAKVGGNNVQYEFSKLMLTSLSGKFGQRSAQWEYRPDIIAPQEWGTFYLPHPKDRAAVECKSIGGHALVEQQRGETDESCPAISAFVNSYARVYLHKLQDVAGYYNVFYIDTDSLFVSADGMENLMGAGYVDGRAIGKLKVVGIHDYCEFRGLKDYSTSAGHVIAGIKSSASWGPDGEFCQFESERLPSLLRRKPDGTILVRYVRKRLRTPTVQGHVGPDGWVIPTQEGL